MERKKEVVLQIEVARTWRRVQNRFLLNSRQQIQDPWKKQKTIIVTTILVWISSVFQELGVHCILFRKHFEGLCFPS